MTSTTTEDRGLCAVCLRSVAVCDGKTCQYDPAASALPITCCTHPHAREAARVPGMSCPDCGAVFQLPDRGADLQRPTDRQLALIADHLEFGAPGHNHGALEELEEAKERAQAWLRALVPPEVMAEVEADIEHRVTGHEALATMMSEPAARFVDEEENFHRWENGRLMCEDVEVAICNPDLRAWKRVDGEDDHDKSTQATACMTHATAETSSAVATVTTATVGTSPTVDGHWTDNASKAASIAAGGAARDAIAAGGDPLIVVDVALAQIARYRELTGLSAAYVARDPLAQLVSELRHKRVPSQFARVVGAMAKSSEHDAALEGGYEDGHERRGGDWSLLELLDLVELATFEGSREELAEKAVEEAARIAGMLVDWRGAIADNRAGTDDGYDPDDLKIRAEIESAADAFIAGLTKAGAP